MRIVFMGTPTFAVPCLRMLAERHEVVGVVTQPDRPSGRGAAIHESPIKRAAREKGLPLIQPHKLREEAAIAQLREWRPTVIIVVAFGKLLPKVALDLPRLGCVNVHASLLPRWRGAAPIQAAILAGDTESGISIMQMDEGLDTGPILSQAHYPLSRTTTGAELHNALSELGALELARILPALARGEIQPMLQEDTCATYAPQLRRADGKIDWRQPAKQIERQLRAYDPWPGSFTSWSGQRLIIHGGEVDVGDEPPGQVALRDGRLAIGCGEGVLLPERLQLAGKRALLTGEFIRGRPEVVGAQLGAANDSN